MDRAIYNLIITILYIPYVCLILFRKVLNKEHKSKFKEKILFNNARRPNGYLFWFHAVSLGEFNSILPFIDFYLKKDEKFKFLITTTTLSSYNEYKKKFRDNNRVFHQFLPYDFGLLINNFLKNWRPDIVLFVDSEIWPNFIFEIKKKKLPFILLNGRITKKTFKKWFFFKNLSYDLFSSFSLCISSNKETAEYLKLLKAKNIKYFGNIKFCQSFENKTKNSTDQFNLLINKKTWCALSTHQDEELFCANVHRLIEKSKKNITTIIIPRHIDRINKIHFNLKKLNLNVQIKNESDSIREDAQIVLVNYYGSTLKYLDHFKQIFVGKSLVSRLKSVGGQNPIDAAKMGCKIYHGPYVYNFQEIYDYLDHNNFSEKIESVENLAEKLIANFEKNSEQNLDKIKKINIYSKQIFDNVIREYDKFIK